jgi:hypothetical protein
MYVAQQLGHYPPEYVRSHPTPERMLETVERIEEDLTDVSRIHRPMAVNVRIGEAIVVSPKRERGTADDPVMAAVESQLHQLLQIPPYRAPDSQSQGQCDAPGQSGPASDHDPSATRRRQRTGTPSP